MERLAGTGFAAIEFAALCIGAIVISTARGFANRSCTKLRRPHCKGREFNQSLQVELASASFTTRVQAGPVRERAQRSSDDRSGPLFHPATHAGASAVSTVTRRMAVDTRRIELLDFGRPQRLPNNRRWHRVAKLL